MNKKFCDICDKEIKQGKKYFEIDVNVKKKKVVNHFPLIETNEVNLILCKKCFLNYRFLFPAKI